MWSEWGLGFWTKVAFVELYPLNDELALLVPFVSDIIVEFKASKVALTSSSIWAFDLAGWLGYLTEAFYVVVV